MPLLAKVSKALHLSRSRDGSSSALNMMAAIATPIARVGLQGGVTCLAYDPVCGILAVATTAGEIMLCGDANFERVLRIPALQSSESYTATMITHIALCIGEGVVAAMDSQRYVHICDVTMLEPRISYYIAESIPTYMEIPAGSPWLFIGCQNGRTMVCHTEKKFRSAYFIPNHGSWASSIISIQAHTYDDDLLLFGHADGALALWSLSKRTLQQRYKPVDFGVVLPVRTEPTHMTGLCWKPNGEDFVTTYDNGWIAFWRKDKTEHLAATSTAKGDITQESAAFTPPVLKAIWYLGADSTTTRLLLAGGFSGDAALHCNTYSQAASAQEYSASSSSARIAIKGPLGGETIQHILPIFSSPWPAAWQTPVGLLALTTRGDVIGIDLRHGTKSERILLPPSLGLISATRSTGIGFCIVNEAAIVEINAACELCIDKRTQLLPAKGSFFEQLPNSKISDQEVQQSETEHNTIANTLISVWGNYGSRTCSVQAGVLTPLSALTIHWSPVHVVLLSNLVGLAGEDISQLARWCTDLEPHSLEISWHKKCAVMSLRNNMLVFFRWCKNVTGATSNQTNAIGVEDMENLNENSQPQSPQRYQDMTQEPRDIHPAHINSDHQYDWVILEMDSEQQNDFAESTFIPICVRVRKSVTEIAEGQVTAQIARLLDGVILAVAEGSKIYLYNLPNNKLIYSLQVNEYHLPDSTTGTSPATVAFMNWDITASTLTVQQYYLTIGTVKGSLLIYNLLSTGSEGLKTGLQLVSGLLQHKKAALINAHLLQQNNEVDVLTARQPFKFEHLVSLGNFKEERLTTDVDKTKSPSRITKSPASISLGVIAVYDNKVVSYKALNSATIAGKWKVTDQSNMKFGSITSSALMAHEELGLIFDTGHAIVLNMTTLSVKSHILVNEEEGTHRIALPDHQFSCVIGNEIGLYTSQFGTNSQPVLRKIAPVSKPTPAASIKTSIVSLFTGSSPTTNLNKFQAEELFGFAQSNARTHPSPFNNAKATELASSTVVSTTASANNMLDHLKDGLSERQERLEHLEEKFSELENESRNFATMAKQLNQKEKDRKWYQL